MGESVAAASNDEHKMGEGVNSNSALEVSVSFGRFDNDSLSWEKWSSFSPNKYMEEVEKCATPGSVAKKAAYFEAHYKKIAARKAELLDQEKQTESKSFTSGNLICGDLSENTCGADSRFSISTGQRSSEEDKHENNLVSQFSEAHVDKQNEDPPGNIECQMPLTEEVKEEIDDSLDSGRTKLEKPEEAALVNEEEEKEICSKGSQDTKEMLQNMDKDIENTKTTEKSMKVDHPRISQKANLMNNRTTTKKNTPVSKERSVAGIKKKPVSSVTKAPEFSTPRMSRPKPTSTVMHMSMSRSSTKKENVSTLPRSNQPSLGGSRKMAPKSLHLSLSLGPSGSDPASHTAMRKSSIMEKMGDKEIVKRAFKTFQNSFSQLKSPGDERTAAPKQVAAKGINSGFSTLSTPRKEMAGSPLSGSMEKKSLKSAPVSFGLKSNGSTGKQKEFSKKSEKFNSRQAERMTLKTNPKESMTKNLSQSLNLKTTPTEGLNQGGRISKGPSDKGLWARKLASSTNSMGKIKNF